MAINKIKTMLGIDKVGAYLREDAERMKMLAAQTNVRFVKEHAGKLKHIHHAEFSVFSQWGDDGIIQYLIHTIGITTKSFIEFGVGNYLEANTRFLLLNNNWKGLVIDGSEKNVSFIKNDPISWKYSIDSICAFITRDNLPTLIANAGFSDEIGLLHIDVDGNDYWFWETLTTINPVIVIMEYNSVFGNKGAISVPYKPDFFVTNEHYSNLYFGASLKAMNHLAEQKGYTLVGSNSHGNNAYFVRNDCMKNLQKMSVDEAYVKCHFRQNRTADGGFTFKDDTEVIKQFGHLPVIDVTTNQQTKLEHYL